MDHDAMLEAPEMESEADSPQDAFQEEAGPPDVKVNPHDFKSNLGKVIAKAIDAVPVIEKVEKQEHDPSILELNELTVSAEKIRSNIVVFSIRQGCHGGKKWRTLAIQAQDYDLKAQILKRYSLQKPEDVVIHAITLLPLVSLTAPTRSLLLAYDSVLQFWFFDGILETE